MTQRTDRGFTLIELLVVIAIITILAAILFPVFATAREKARQATCASNEKQILMACLQYTQDYDEFEVTYSNPAGTNGWDNIVYPYVTGTNHIGGNYGWEQCPDDNLVRATGTVTRSYALNGGGEKYDWQSVPGLDGPAGGWTTFGGPPNGAAFYAIPMGQISAPAATILLVEFPTTTNEASRNSDDGSGSPASQAQFVPAPLHSGGWNYGFCDGHVKWYQPQMTVGSDNVGTCGTTNHGTGSLSSPCGMWTLDSSD